MAETAEAVEEKAQEGQEQQNDAGQADSKTQVQSVELSEAAGTETTGAGGSI